MAFDLNPVAVTSAPLLRAIAAGGFSTLVELAGLAGRDPKNMSRDLATVRNSGLVDPSEIVLTDDGRDQLAALDRAANTDTSSGSDPNRLSLRYDQIRPDPDQVRKDWDSDEAVADLQALAGDVADRGILQDPFVRPSDEPGVWFLIGGERRWRAIGLLIADGRWPADRTIDCKLRIPKDELDNRLAALSENMQRRNLNPIEEAEAYRGLREGGLTTEQIAGHVRMTVRHVQGRLQLLALLSEDQQRRMTLPADDKDRLSVSDARKLVQNAEAKARAREKLEAELSPRARLIFAEVRLAKPGWYIQVPVDGVAINADPDAVALHQAGYLDLPTSYDLDGAAYAQIEHAGFDQITTLFGDTGLESNAAYAARLRTELNLPTPEEGRFSTPWLNGPFEIPAEARADIEARIAAREASAQAYADRQREEAEARQATRDAQAQVAAEARALFDARRQTSQGVPVEDLLTIAGRADAPLPWRMNSQNAVLAADGELIIGAGPSDRSAARMRLLVLGVNAAAGLDTPEDEVPEPEQAVDGSDADAEDEDDGEDA